MSDLLLLPRAEPAEPALFRVAHEALAHFGLRGLQRLVGDDGGRLVVEAARPRGVRVEATLSSQGGQLDAPLAGRRRR